MVSKTAAAAAATFPRKQSSPPTLQKKLFHYTAAVYTIKLDARFFTFQIPMISAV
jgi:hypothetical protein